MCAKPEPFNYMQPIANLHEELGAENPLQLFGWAGIVGFYGMLANL